MRTLMELSTLAIAVLIGSNLLNFCLKNHNNTIYLFAAVYLYEILAHLFSFSVTLVSFGPFRMGPSDLLYIVLLLLVYIPALKHRPTGVSKKNIVYACYLVLQLMFLFSLLRGILSNGLSSDVITDVRRFYCFLVPAMYMLNTDMMLEDERSIKFINNFMTSILVFCYCMWGIIILSGLRLAVTTNEGGTYLRIMGPETTLVLVLWVLYLISNDLNSRGYISVKAIIGVLAVIIMQQRTVWICFFVGAFVIALNYRSISELPQKWTINKNLLLQITGLLCFLFIVIYMSPEAGIISDIKNSASSFSNLETGTFAYRTMLWEGHLQTLKGTEILIGKSFGAGYLVDLKAGYSRVITPHNGYIHTALRTGAAGVIVLVIMLSLMSIRGKNRRQYYIPMIAAIILVYFIGYTYTWYIGVAVGFCLRRSLENGTKEEYMLSEGMMQDEF